MSTSEAENEIFQCHNFSKLFKLKGIIQVDDAKYNCADIRASEIHA